MRKQILSNGIVIITENEYHPEENDFNTIKVIKIFNEIIELENWLKVNEYII